MKNLSVKTCGFRTVSESLSQERLIFVFCIRLQRQAKLSDHRDSGAAPSFTEGRGQAKGGGSNGGVVS